MTVSPTPPSETTSVGAAQPTSTTTGSPTWPWWLLGALAVAIAIAFALVLASRRRGKSWSSQVLTATGEVVWFARQLIPQLQRDETRDQVAGPWQVTRARVSLLEDTLTGLESTAPKE